MSPELPTPTTDEAKNGQVLPNEVLVNPEESPYENFMSLYYDIKFLREYAGTNNFPISIVHIDNDAVDFLKTADGLANVVEWNHSFQQTFGHFDESIRQAREGRRFSKREWQLGVDACIIALTALVQRAHTTA